MCAEVPDPMPDFRVADAVLSGHLFQGSSAADSTRIRTRKPTKVFPTPELRLRVTPSPQGAGCWARV